MNYYNEFDPLAAAWLRELIAQGSIPPGLVDTRSITQVTPNDLSEFIQCHFFAGIGGWPLALQIAGVPNDFPLWTGSCPCQPFSTCGKQLGDKDERHLWPAFFRLIQECSPSIIFGEQVASPAALLWLDRVFDDLEGSGYTCGAGDLCASSVGAPHIRQRLYWVAGRNGRMDKPDFFRGTAGIPRPDQGQEGHAGIADHSGNQEFPRERERELRGWSTPSSRDWKDSAGMNTQGINPDGSLRNRTDQLPRQALHVLGTDASSSTAKTEKREGLNPAFVCWLMGFPVEWCQAAIRAHRKLKPRRKRG